jgi:thiol-disulfide isomerase/thioredoxin
LELFEVTDSEGKTVVFGAGSTKPSLLVLFTTWCGSCQKATPSISEIAAPYLDHIQLIGIGREHEAKELNEWAKETQTHYQLIPDPERKLYSHFAKMHVPRIYLIDTMGKVLYQDVNWHPFMLEDIKQAIENCIKTSA